MGFYIFNNLSNYLILECKSNYEKDKIDLIALLDGSGSVEEINFNKLTKFLSAVVNGIKIGLSDTRVGVIQYSSTWDIRKEIDLNTYSDAISLSENIRKIEYLDGGTDTGHAMNYTTENGFLTKNVS